MSLHGHIHIEVVGGEVCLCLWFKYNYWALLCFFPSPETCEACRVQGLGALHVSIQAYLFYCVGAWQRRTCAQMIYDLPISDVTDMTFAGSYLAAT